MNISKWFVWCFVPYFNFVAWIHAAIRTGRKSYYWFAAFYALPVTSAILLGAVEKELKLTKAFVDHFSDLGGSVGVVLWIAGMIHVMVNKNKVDQQIQVHKIVATQTAFAALAATDRRTQLESEVSDLQNVNPQSHPKEIGSLKSVLQPKTVASSRKSNDTNLPAFGPATDTFNGIHEESNLIAVNAVTTGLLDYEQELRKLAKLMNDEIISAEDYEQKKKALLGL